MKMSKEETIPWPKIPFDFSVEASATKYQLPTYKRREERALFSLVNKFLILTTRSNLNKQR